MRRPAACRAGTSSSFTAVALVTISLIAAGLGLTLFYENTIGKAPAVTTTTVINETTLTTTTSTHVAFTEAMSAIPFLPAPYQQIQNAWLLFAPSEGGRYVMSIHAESLLPSKGANGSSYYYLVEAIEPNNTAVPLGPSANSSIFSADDRGIGEYFIVLNQNPRDVYLSIQIVRVDSLKVSNRTAIAGAALNTVAPG